MGADLSIPKEDLRELLQSTVFKKNELKRWYKKFMKSYPDGKLDIKQFNDVFSKLEKPTTSHTFSPHMFRSFDRDNNGFISFKNLMCSFSVVSRGTKRQRLEWAFNVFDLDRDGKISMEEICNVAQCISSSSGRADESEQGLDVAELFIRVDKDLDGYWTLNEFIEGVCAYPCIFKKTLNVG